MEKLIEKANLGDSHSQYLLGKCYDLGEEVKRNIELSIHYYNLAVEQGNSDAQYILGYKYLEGTGVTQNLEKAMMLLKLSADQGNYEAQFLYGLQIADESHELSAKYLQLSADQKYVFAQCELGLYYEIGCGVKQDINKAIEYYKLALEKEFPRAYGYLAKCYELGTGVKQDLKKSEQYYKIALEAGFDKEHLEYCRNKEN